MKNYNIQYLLLVFVTFITLGCKNNDIEGQLSEDVAIPIVERCFEFVHANYSSLTKTSFFNKITTQNNNFAYVSELVGDLLYEVQFKTAVIDQAVIQDTVSIRCIFEQLAADNSIILIAGPKSDFSVSQHMYFFKDSFAYSNYTEKIHKNQQMKLDSVLVNSVEIDFTIDETNRTITIL